jgi:epoxyqueuosine reductase
MGKMDLTGAKRPTRGRVGGTDVDRAKRFRSRMPPSARRSVFIRQEILWAEREPKVNPHRFEIDDPAKAADEFKAMAREMGADEVGIAAIDPNLVFTQAGDFTHTPAIVFDVMADIGPDSQAEVHRVYHALDELGVRLANQIAAYGYSARMQPNEGDVPLPAMAYLAGLGELGKHGSMISPTLGSSFRLGAVTTDMPLKADGPKDFGIFEVCSKCQMCSRFCPGEAIASEPQEVNGLTRWHIDTPACEPFFHKLYGCKICLMVCPFNAKGDFKDAFKALSKDLIKAKDAPGLLDMLTGRTDMHLDEFKDD